MSDNEVKETFLIIYPRNNPIRNDHFTHYFDMVLEFTLHDLNLMISSEPFMKYENVILAKLKEMEHQPEFHHLKNQDYLLQLLIMSSEKSIIPYLQELQAKVILYFKE